MKIGVQIYYDDWQGGTANVGPKLTEMHERQRNRVSTASGSWIICSNSAEGSGRQS
jgi:hypothetical protein